MVFVKAVRKYSSFAKEYKSSYHGELANVENLTQKHIFRQGIHSLKQITFFQCFQQTTRIF